MENKILGIHHITAIAGDASRNFAFYTEVLGLRLVKKTVNFDDPGTYHLYYGDEVGSPGSILTFFPWQNARRGKSGVGMATEILYSVPSNSLDFWKQRLDEFKVQHEDVVTRFGKEVLSFDDPDGLRLTLVDTGSGDSREPWTTADIQNVVAIRGFYGIGLTVKNTKPTADVLTKIFEYTRSASEGNYTRYISPTDVDAGIVDLIEDAAGKPGIGGAGTNHHVAFRVKDEEALMMFREKVMASGHQITTKIDRNYFFSLYFREPGGILFEIATDNPGFTIDESKEELGSNLKLPAQYEAHREELIKVLPPLHKSNPQNA